MGSKRARSFTGVKDAAVTWFPATVKQKSAITMQVTMAISDTAGPLI